MKKEIWREKWLGCINELTSFELQKKSWLDKTQTNPHWSFVEFMCSYFDDLVIEDNYKYPLDKDWVTRQEFEIIRDWHQALDEYNFPNNDSFDNEAIINDPKWLDIMQKGVNAKNKLVEILSKTEKQFLTEEIDYLNYI